MESVMEIDMRGIMVIGSSKCVKNEVEKLK
jgi:hypothetical protein